jgi:hypothetical protein
MYDFLPTFPILKKMKVSLWNQLVFCVSMCASPLLLLGNGLANTFFLFGIVGVESNWVHSALQPAMAYCAGPVWLWWWRNWWNDDWQGKPKYSGKTCPSAALSTTNLTCCPDANPGRRGGKPATNRLSYDTACQTPSCGNEYTQHNILDALFYMRTLSCHGRVGYSMLYMTYLK